MTRARAVRSGWAAAVGMLMVAGAADAQTVRGSVDVQYQSFDRVALSDLSESWIKNVRLDYARSLPGSMQLSSQLFYNEQTFARRSDRVRTPQGTLQLTHPIFGLLTSYRPVEVRDSKNITTRQQEAALTGYFQKPSFPRLTGSWIRRHADATAVTPAATWVTRSLAGTYELGPVGFRAGYGDQYRDAQSGLGRRAGEDHFNLGSSANLMGRRSSLSMQYDFNQSRARPQDGGPITSHQHTAGASGSLRISSRTSGSLNYAYRHAETPRVGSRIDDHDGAVTIFHDLARTVQVSGSGGLRTAAINGNNQTERYVGGAVTARGEARPGWTLGGSAGQSWNWLPGSGARPISSLQSNTSMRLAPGLTASGDATITSTKTPVAGADTAARLSDVTLVTGAGVLATPLRTVTVDARLQSTRTGTKLTEVGPPSTTYHTRMRLRPSEKLQFGGTWGQVRGFGSRATTFQTDVQWNPRSSLQTTGSYARSRQRSTLPLALAGSDRETYSASVAMALAWDLTGTIRYSELDPGRRTHTRQVNAALTLSFGR